MMPLYEYRCPKCNITLELMQKFSDPPPLCACTEGDPVVMQKQMSLGNFQLKGKGWYRTEYGKK